MSDWDFSTPLWFALLPLALLPWITGARETVALPTLGFIPADRIGPWLSFAMKTAGFITFVSLLFAMAGPGQSAYQQERIGRGAELSILMDRSASMDANVRRHVLKIGEQARPSITKAEVVRSALTKLVEQRPNNRYALTLFNVSAIPVAPFSDDEQLVLAGLRATALGRGPNKTNMGLALRYAIEQFDQRAYTGSRAIILVSDGGAKLSETLRQQISEGLKRNRISLYFIYIQSDANSPNLETVGVDAVALVEEVALHVFFKQLDTEYKVFQANDPVSMQKAVEQIDLLQNQPLRYQELIPRLDYSHWGYLTALISCVALFLLSSLRIHKL
ncbi:MAG: VWA domain-containing protein [Granulosicoccus sp.]